MSKKNNISDAELSLITAISGLDNKLEELDHNISLLSKRTSTSTNTNNDETKFSQKIKELEEQILKLDHKVNDQNKADLNKKYLSTLPTRARFSNQKKGYVLAENLRLKRIESIEQSLNKLLLKLDDQKLEQEISINIPSEILPQSNEFSISEEEEFYLRSKGIFFGFIFSIFLILLLIIVSSETNIFI